ncbi:MAG: histidine phosphatase family protein, partial [Acidimicrobiales bacterium]
MAALNNRENALLLVRHAVALSRSRWLDDDALRPLGERGRRQAEALVDQLGDFEMRRVLSSPALRCRQTVTPLAEARGLQVEIVDDLDEGTGLRGVSLVRELGDGGVGGGGVVVLCSHGDLIPTVVESVGGPGI